jgi:signal transduction histidine kinase/PAS domain-containing protein
MPPAHGPKALCGPDPKRSKMYTNRRRGEAHVAHGSNAPAASVLVIAGAPEAPARWGAIESAGAGAFRISVVNGVSAALEWLRRDPFDAVILDLGRKDAPEVESMGRVREMAGSATLIVTGRDLDLSRAVELGADEWIAGGGSTDAIAGCIRGAVECRRLREELAESEARFRSIVERTADGIVIVDEDGRIQFVNCAAERMFGRSAVEIIGQEFGRAVLAGEMTEMDILRNAEAEPIVAELRASDTTWDGAEAQIVTLRDVTDRKRAEEQGRRLLLERAAREQAERAGQRFRFLAEAGATLDASLSSETMLVRLARLIVPRVADWCVIDLLEGDQIRRVAVAHTNPEKQDLLEELKDRFPPNADSPQPSARVLRSGAGELHQELDAESMRELTVNDAHARLLLQLGTRSSMTVPLDVRGHRLGAMTFVCGERDFDESDFALAREIASRAARALDNARLYEAALAANRAKSDFLAVMSHELRTPLNAIIGYTDLLLANITGPMDGEQCGYLRRIHFGAMQLLQIIEEILTYAQTEAGHIEALPRAIRMGELIDEVVEVAEPLVREKGLELRLEVGQPNAELFTDAGKLRQILLNLLRNAVKFTERGAIGLSVELRGDQLVIAISDTGIGIAPEKLEEIFEPFRQVEQGTTRRAGGTGIGLSVSRQLARLLGGDVSVESRPGHGSTFALRLPRRLAATQPDGE